MTQLSTTRLMTMASAISTIGTLGFYVINGMIVDDAGGNPWINAFYCSVITLTT